MVMAVYVHEVHGVYAQWSYLQHSFTLISGKIGRKYVVNSPLVILTPEERSKHCIGFLVKRESEVDNAPPGERQSGEM